MLDKRFINVCGFRQRQFQHDILAFVQRVQFLRDFRQQQGFRFRLVGDRDSDLRLDNRNQPVRQDLAANFELLFYNIRDTLRVGRIDDRTHFGAKHPLGHTTFQQAVQFRHRFHHLRAVLFFRQTLVAFQERNHAQFFP